jgi:hypothetical protein
MSLTPYGIEFPEGFNDYAWEAEAKGWLQGAIAIIEGRRYRVTFYDPTRLAQDIEDELKGAAVFLERNLVVVQSVTRAKMEAAIDVVARTGRQSDMVPEAEEPGL